MSSDHDTVPCPKILQSVLHIEYEFRTVFAAPFCQMIQRIFPMNRYDLWVHSPYEPLQDLYQAVISGSFCIGGDLKLTIVNFKDITTVGLFSLELTF